MAKPWRDPAKLPPKSETLNTPGDFSRFTAAMKAILKVKPEKKPASPGPVSAS
jgi:hypothetical protein